MKTSGSAWVALFFGLYLVRNGKSADHILRDVLYVEFGVWVGHDRSIHHLRCAVDVVKPCIRVCSGKELVGDDTNLVSSMKDQPALQQPQEGEARWPLIALRISPTAETERARATRLRHVNDLPDAHHLTTGDAYHVVGIAHSGGQRYSPLTERMRTSMAPVIRPAAMCWLIALIAVPWESPAARPSMKIRPDWCKASLMFC